MSYIGNQPFTAAFLTDQFSGNGSTVAFTLSAAPANTNSIIVAVSGVLQDPTTYSVSGTTLTFSAAPPAGTGNISVRFLGIPASGVVNTAYRTVTEFTATAGQTTFSVPSYTVGYIDVYRNGALLGSADFTATNGTTVVLANAASAGDLIETVSFFVSSVANAVPTTGGTFSGNVLFASGDGIWNTSGSVGIGTSSPSSRLHVSSTSQIVSRFDSTNSGGPLLGFYKSGSILSYVGASGGWIGNSSTDLALAAETGNGIGFFVNGSGSSTGGFTSSGNFSFNSGYGSAATAYGCRAWVNFNGSGGVSIRGSGNIASVVRTSGGVYYATFTNNMPDINFCCVGSASVSNGNFGLVPGDEISSRTVNKTGTFYTVNGANTNNAADANNINIAIFR